MVDAETSLKYTSGLVGCVTDVVLGGDLRLSLLSMATTGRNVHKCD